MNLFLIQSFIKKITKNDINQYAKKENIQLTEKEVEIIYYYIKTKYKIFLKGNQEELLKEIKPQVQPKTYQKILELYNQYKDKIPPTF